MKYNDRKDIKKEMQKNRRRETAGKKSRRAKKRKSRAILLIIEGILLLIVISFIFIISKIGKINRDHIDPTDVSSNSVDDKVAEKLEGYTNIALFGVDARDNKSLGKGTHADVNMICSINNGTGEIRLVSVYRDTYLNVKGDSEFNKLTQAYFSGGASQSISTLNKNLDLNITDYVTVNWKAVADAINILGGIDIDISKSEFTQINGFITETVKATGVGSVHLKSAGMNYLDGIQAVAYARLRLMDTDYKRTERQRKVIGLTMEKAKNADLVTLNKLIDTVLPQVATNLSNTEIFGLARNIGKYHIGETAGFPFDKESKVMGKRGDCVIPLGLEQNVYQLHAFLFANESYKASSAVSKIDQLIKDATNMGAPGTTVKSTVSATTKNPATAAATETETTTEEESAAIAESTTNPSTELSTEDFETTEPAQESSETVTSTESGAKSSETDSIPSDSVVNETPFAFATAEDIPE